MKVFALSLVLAVLSLSCGDDEPQETLTRTVNPGTLVVGPANGFQQVTFADGLSLSFTASGFMSMRLPRGVFEGRPFPAEVTFSVVTSQSDAISGEVSFERLTFLNDNRFEGRFEGLEVNASIVGSLISTTTQTVVQVEAFGYSLPATGLIINNRLALQSPQLVEHAVTPSP